METILSTPIVALILIVLLSVVAAIAVYLPLRNSAAGTFKLLGFELKLAGPSALFFAVLILLCNRYAQFIQDDKVEAYLVRMRVEFVSDKTPIIPKDNTMNIKTLPVDAIQEIKFDKAKNCYVGYLKLKTYDLENLPTIELSHNLFEPKTFDLSGHKTTVLKDGTIEISDPLSVVLEPIIK